mmetsp:Transcript_6988/g.20661  ORF Transcript_6988/g.20661 Transcript_6988/m.20661 type:complete len:287 (-) Transcript_6988:157-1017(-)
MRPQPLSLGVIHNHVVSMCGRSGFTAVVITTPLSTLIAVQCCAQVTLSIMPRKMQGCGVRKDSGHGVVATSCTPAEDDQVTRPHQDSRRWIIACLGADEQDARASQGRRQERHVSRRLCVVHVSEHVSAFTVHLYDGCLWLHATGRKIRKRVREGFRQGRRHSPVVAACCPMEVVSKCYPGEIWWRQALRLSWNSPQLILMHSRLRLELAKVRHAPGLVGPLAQAPYRQVALFMRAECPRDDHQTRMMRAEREAAFAQGKQFVLWESVLLGLLLCSGAGCQSCNIQ